MLLQWWSSVWQYWGRGTHWLSTCVCCLLWVVWLCSSTNPTRAQLLQMTIFLALERSCWWVNIALCPPSLIFLLLPYVVNQYVSYCDFSWLGCVFCCVIAGLFDIGRLDWGGPGSHEGPLPDDCQPHDAKHQLVVHAGAWTKWVNHAFCQTLV